MPSRRATAPVLGIIDDHGARWAELFGEDGEPFRGKVEGISFEPGNTHHIAFVIDSDDIEKSSTIYEAVLDGPWYENVTFPTGVEEA